MNLPETIAALERASDYLRTEFIRVEHVPMKTDAALLSALAEALRDLSDPLWWRTVDMGYGFEDRCARLARERLERK